MTFFPKIKTLNADSRDIDAFGRQRVSEPFTLFDSKQIFSDQPLYWTTKLINSASSSYDSNRSSTILTVPAVSGAIAKRQTRQYFYYQPGKSFQNVSTFLMSSAADGVIKRLGYFDDTNGIFLEQNGSILSFVIRSDASGVITENRISQGSWNVDNLQGSGPSKETLDITKCQIFGIDFQWLGVGRVRVGFDIGGELIVAHEFLHSNIVEAVYMSQPNLPVRYEIENLTGANTGSLEHICTTVLSEGGFDPVGITRAVDRGSSAISFTSGTIPLVSIRLDTSKKGSVITPIGITAMATSGASFRWAVYFNPSFANADSASWQTISGSSVQYDINRNSSNHILSGTLIKSGYVGSGLGSADVGISDAFGSGFSLGVDLDGNSDEIVLAIENLEVGSETFLAGINWKELL